MKELRVKITFIESVLGTMTGDKDVYRSFIGSKAPDASTIEEEVAAIGTEAVVEKGKTYFPRTKEGKPFIYNYQIRGFLKSACGAMSKVPNTACSKIKAYKKKIDQFIFVKDRENVIETSEPLTECQRPLRCQTMQGERVSIAISEEIAAGATCEFTIQCLLDEDVKAVEEMLSYGRFNGFLQWRNSSHGTFTYEIIA